MEKKYSIVPDRDVFFAFLHSRNFDDGTLAEIEQISPQKVIIDNELEEWVVEYTCKVDISELIIAAVAKELTAACDLKKVIFRSLDLEKKDIDFSFIKNKNNIIEAFSNYYPELVPIIRGAIWKQSGNTYIIEFMGDNLLKIAKDKHLAEKIKKVLLSKFSLNNPSVLLMSSDEDMEYQESPNTTEYFNAIKVSESEEATKSNNDIIFGRFISEEPRKIGEVKEVENKVVIEGEVISKEERETRIGSVIFKFCIKDDTDGIIVKMMFGKHRGKEGLEANLRECHAIANKLKEGVLVRVMGNAREDRYERNDLVIENPSGIRKIEKKLSEDNAKLKRVELHCHTKMSKMDAVTPIKELIQTAIRWGHDALAITDHGVVQAFPFAFDEIQGSDLKLIFGCEGYLIERERLEMKKTRPYHVILLAKNSFGLRNLYKLISLSHLKYYMKRPRMYHELINNYRDGLIIGSACEAGEIYQAFLNNLPEDEIIKKAEFYDYLEIQPTANNAFLVRSDAYPQIKSMKDLEAINKRIYELGKKLNKLTVATCDVHFLRKEDEVLRRILQAGQGYQDADLQPPVFFRNTEEMLAEFQYLGKEIAEEVVITNTKKIAAMVEKFKPIPDRDQLYSPQILGAEDKITKMSYERAHKWYGKVLPKIVEERLKTELDSIIGHGFAVLYYIAHKLVKKSLDDGYLVGSRGSVGSSFIATMIDITEVNPLKPHYRCGNCQYSEWIEDNSVSSGFDLPDKKCPKCGESLIKDGHDIPFAVFMGFHGDKVPDIDLNFSGVYQPNAHKYTEDLFGRDNVYKAGTISTVADKTAYGYVKKYFEGKGKEVRNAFVEGMIKGFAGIKKTTGQHPGGIMVVPQNMDIHYITPVQRPADDVNSETITTHYDYHSINDRLVKLDILGHDDPTVIKMLEDLTGIPAKDIPLTDPDTLELFSSTKPLKVKPSQIDSNVGTFGVPESGTKFVRQMLEDVKPKNFSDLLRVSGYSHGTNVWLNNAQDLIRSGIDSSETISTRDDVMTSLIARGVDSSIAFKIMEDVRKGKAAKNGLKPEYLKAMQEANVPKWYIKSCETVQYLFPKAHATAYVMMALRIAYCKVHYPREFYAAFFTIRAPKFDSALVCQGKDFMKKYVKDIYALGTAAKVNDKDTVTYMELAIEMIERGFVFERIDLYKSDPHKFIVTEKGLLPPLDSLSGIGTTAADSIAEARKLSPFISQEDLKNRTRVSQATIDALAEHGALGDLPKTDQIGLF
jgi:DNA polymerase-3 subunit alpha (Gram-positive type)